MGVSPHYDSTVGVRAAYKTTRYNEQRRLREL